LYPTEFFYVSQKYILKRLDKETISTTLARSSGVRSQSMLGVNISFFSPNEIASQLSAINNELYGLETEMRVILDKIGHYTIKSQADIGYPIEWRSDV